MPNWCSNGVTLRHADPQMIQRAATALAAGTFLHEFIPVPLCLRETIAGSVGEDARAAHEKSQQDNLNEHGYKDWYDFCVNEWGTKWDVDSDNVELRDSNTVIASFDSAWAPPIQAYEKLMQQGFEIEAFYYEPGMAFVGKWANGEDDCYDYSGQNSTTVRDYIGEELDDYYSISADMADYEEENADN